MAISPLWPKPSRWPIQQGLCHPGTAGSGTRGRASSCLCRSTPARARAALCPPRANAQDGKDLAAQHRRRGHAHPLRPRCQHPHDRPRRDRGPCRQQSNFAAWEQNEPYTIDLLLKGRSGGASTKHLYRSGTSSTADHILFLSSGTTPNLRHQASGGGTVTITSSVAIVNDTTWSTIVGTWATGTPRAVRVGRSKWRPPKTWEGRA
jgi:hypothetical protein